jgi:hypothetical protein
MMIMRFLSIYFLSFLFTINIISQDTIVNYSHDAGFYNSNFDLTMTSSIESLSICYTLDGSNPNASITSYTVASPVTISINPDDTASRGKTPGVVVRAIVKGGNKFIGSPQCKSYIFLDKVKDQTAPGKNWPIESYKSVKGHNIDYSMDSAIVYNPKYNNLITNSLLDIPTLSVATDLKNLFDPATGIYVNAGLSGEVWERECSFELIYPDNTQKFQINAGIRTKGGWSRQQAYNPKYSLRLLFKDIYGAGKLKYPLFGEEGAATFNHIDLRTEQNCSWTLDGGNAKYNTFIRDAFSRDAQHDMGWEYMRSDYYHLYINGMYWGLYTIQERVDNDYAKTYFGGNEDDYDIIKADELVDGNQDTWKQLWTITQQGFTTNKNYYLLEGKNAYGEPIPGKPVLCDIDNLIDYMVLVFYTGNYDGPCSKWGNNKTGANFVTLKDRTDNSFGFKFFALDFEYSMFIESVYIGVGLYENRVNIGYLTDEYQMSITNISEFNPQWLHYKLSKNAEYRTRFANRAYKLLKENGALTPEKNLERFITREKQVEDAITAESARWGDAKTKKGLGFTSEDWLLEVNSLKDIFIPQRTDIVIDQLKEAGLFSTLLPPTISVGGETNNVEVYQLIDNVDITIRNTSNDGVAYYTLDGTDPMDKEGTVNLSANKIDGTSKTLNTSNSLRVIARTKTDTEWGPMRSMKILAPVSKEDYSMLKVTELNYHPLKDIVLKDTTDGDDFEFIELKNTGDKTLNISGLRIDSAIQFVAPENTVIVPQQYFVIAGKPSKFFNRYGFVASGNFSGKFSNSGEYILVEDSMRNEIFSFTYSDSYPWPTKADGAGFTLMSVESNPTGDPNDVGYWKLSQNINGNPFFDTTYTYVDTQILHPTLSHYNLYPNPASEYLIIENNNDQTINTDVSFIDLSGRVAYSAKFDNSITVNLKQLQLSQGLYFVNIKSGDKIEVKKVVIR